MSVHYQIAGRTAAQISDSVEAGVRSGALAPGDPLPPVRVLAAELGLAAATVASAYRVLRQRGVVETAGRNGTRVRARPPVARRMSHRGPAPTGVLDLSLGEPDVDLQPSLEAQLARLARTAATPVRYGESGPWPELVALARERFAADGIPMATAALTVTSGALDALERLLTSHLRPGDRVGIEDPGWANLIDLIAALGLQAEPIRVDDEGPTVESLARAIAVGATAIVVTSRAQNPTGAAVTAERAAKLRRLLGQHPELLVIEDDHAAELAEVPLAPLAGAGHRWAFVRSVSKPYGPDLRLAVVAGDEATIARVEGRMRLGAGWVSTLLQRLVVELWRDESVAVRVHEARSEYGRRRSALLAALSGRGVAAHGRSGINVWVPVADEPSAIAALRDRNIAVAPGSLYRLASPPGLRVTVSPLSGGSAGMSELADALAAAVNPQRVSPAGAGVRR